MRDADKVPTLEKLGGGSRGNGNAILLRLGIEGGEQIAIAIRLEDVAGLMLHLDTLAAQAIKQRKAQRQCRSRAPAIPSLGGEITRIKGRTAADGTPMLELELGAGLPLSAALTPLNVIVLHNFLSACRPVAARRLSEAERDRDRRLVDDEGDTEPTGSSQLARLASR